MRSEQRPQPVRHLAAARPQGDIDHRGGARNEQHAQPFVAGRLMPPIRCSPPVERSFGVRPAQAARWRPDSNIAGSISTANVNGMIGPTPGMETRRWLTSFGINFFDTGVDFVDLLEPRTRPSDAPRRSRLSRLPRIPWLTAYAL
jgi:hypothetical protein